MLEHQDNHRQILQRLPQKEENYPAGAVPEEMVFCECDHPDVDCTPERWKICKHRIERDAVGLYRFR